MWFLIALKINSIFLGCFQETKVKKIILIYIRISLNQGMSNDV